MTNQEIIRKVDNNLKSVIRRRKEAIPSWFSVRHLEDFFFLNIVKDLDEIDNMYT